MHEVLVEKYSNGEICYWSTFKWIYACRVTWYATACVRIKLMEKLLFSLQHIFKCFLLLL